MSLLHATRYQSSPTDHGIPRVPWEHLGPEFMRAWGWPNGKWEPEHLTVYGKSGSGKTYFVRYILRQRLAVRGSHIVVVATKKADKMMAAFKWPIITSWPPNYGQRAVIYWAKPKSLHDNSGQKAKIVTLMDELWVPDSNIVVFWDELAYVEEDLGLRRQMKLFYREGRSLGITNVSSMQRPTGVTRLAHSEAGWTVAFPPKDQDDRKRVAEVLGDRAFYSAVLRDLDRTKYEFLLAHDLTGECYISHLPDDGIGIPARTGRAVPSVRR